jgi:coenzyme F420-0:L-glutamate ligase/coenzyme F420-1:gamma-L-glutamate ligase
MAESSVLEAIHQRRSIRRYEDRPVERDLIERIIEAGTWSPSGHNRQPWRFVVLQDFAIKERLALAMGARLRADLERDHLPEDVIGKETSRSYERLTAAPVLILVCLTMAQMDVYKDEKRNHNEFVMAVQSVAMAGQNILLAAHDLGLGACWTCAPLFCPDVVSETLDLPEDWQAQGIITMGYPAQERRKTREPLETRIVWR